MPTDPREKMHTRLTPSKFKIQAPNFPRRCEGEGMLRAIRSLHPFAGGFSAGGNFASSKPLFLAASRLSTAPQSAGKDQLNALSVLRNRELSGICRELTTLSNQYQSLARSPKGCVHRADGRRFFASQKEVFWDGTKRSLDPTAPSVVPRRPTTPSQRHTAIIDKSLLWRKGPVSRLTVGLRKSGGRNNQGVITVRHRGGGNKRRYRIIDFKRVQMNNNAIISGTVERIEYDPNRTAFIALLKHKLESAEPTELTVTSSKASTNLLSYVLCPRGINVGTELMASRTKPVDIRPGNSMQLRFIPVGTTVHNIELAPGRGGQLCRSAGTSAQVLETDEVRGLSLLRLQSKEQRYVRINCLATVGEVSNPEFKNQSLGKAGRNRWRGRRPSVRGVAMNPIDHPHGGGEGRTHHGGPPRSPWGMLTKGYKTVRKLNPLIRVPRWKARRDK